jgi:hypothetical protein
MGRTSAPGSPRCLCCRSDCPWSLPSIIDPYQFDGLSAVPWTIVSFGPAMLNVLLHGAVLLAAGRLRRR